MSIPRIKRRTIITHMATAVVSIVLFAIVGTVYVDTRINRAFGGLCEILLISTEPYPKPPQSPSVPPPTSEYGKALKSYNDEVATRQAKGLRALNSAVEKYHCKN